MSILQGEINMSEIFEPIIINGTEYRLRYPGLVQISISKTVGKELFGRVDNQKFGLEDILNHLGDPEAQSYLLWKGIQGGMPERRTMKFEEAVGLRDAFLDEGGLDAGEKHQELCDILAMAVTAARGADGKKLKEKNEELQKKEKAEKEKTLIELIDARIKLHGIGGEQPNSVLEI